MGEALRGVGDPGRDPVHHGAASPSTPTVNRPRPISAQFATEPIDRLVEKTKSLLAAVLREN
jgi:hypothetical protein